MRTTGSPIPATDLAALSEFNFALTAAASELGLNGEQATVAALAAAQARAARAHEHKQIERLRALKGRSAGYETAITSLMALVDAAVDEPGDDASAVLRTALGSIVSYLDRDATLSLDEFQRLRDELSAVGVDESIALGVFGRELSLEPPRESSVDAPADERASEPEPEADDGPVADGSLDVAASEHLAPDRERTPRAGPAPDADDATDTVAAPNSPEAVAEDTAPVPAPEDSTDSAPDEDIAAGPEPEPEARSEPAVEDTGAPAAEDAIASEDRSEPAAEPTSAAVAEPGREDDAKPATEDTAVREAAPDPASQPDAAVAGGPPTPRRRAAAAAPAQPASVALPHTDAGAAALASLETGDLSLAYWLMRSVEESSGPPPIPAAAIAALLHAQRTRVQLDPESEQYEDQTLDAVTGHLEHPAGVLVLVAAALRASMVVPYGSAINVLRENARMLGSGIEKLSARIAERAPRGELLQLSRATAQTRAAATREALREEVALKAMERLEHARGEFHTFVPATMVWTELGVTGPLAAILRSAQAGPPGADDITIIERFSDGRELDREIDRIYARLRRGRTEAKARQWIRRNAARTLEIAHDWVAAYADEEPRGDGAVTSGLPWLRGKVREISPYVEQDLHDFESSGDEHAKVAASLFRTEWSRLERYIVGGITPPDVPVDGLAPEEARCAALARATDLLPSGLQVGPERLRDAAPSLIAASDVTWQVAFETRCEQGAFALARIALERLPQERREELASMRRAAMEAATQRLAHDHEETRREVDAALREQTLTDRDHDDLVRRLTAIQMSVEAVEEGRSRLTAIREELGERERERGNRLRKELVATKPSDEERATIEALLDEGEMAIATEQLARLVAGDLSDGIASGPRKASVRQFLTFCHKHPESTIASLWKTFEREDDVRAVGALRRLDEKRSYAKGANSACEAVRSILYALGLEPVGVPVYEEQITSHLQLLRADVRTESGSCPVPDFGSRSKGRYRALVVLRDGFVERDIVPRVKSLNPRAGNPIVLLCTQPLSMGQRDALARLAAREHVTFLIVDPMVLAYVCAGSDDLSRAERLFASTLPWTWTNPYVTHGVVPREVFIGRDQELQMLVDPSGSAFIYGGRQLGKSALLMKAHREFHDPRQGRCAILLDLDAHRIGHGNANTDLVWSYIGAELSKRDVGFGADLTTESAVSDGIVRWLDRNRQRSLLILLDETDHFLEQEAEVPDDGRPRMRNVIAMRDLMTKTDGRLKFVLAGLHSVQRFLNLPNQPFAHLGAPTPIGPLAWNDARALVERPMTALGYEFDKHVVDRILTLTNRHPSLVQHVCRALVDHLARRPRRTTPMTVSLEDLEDVYNRRDLRSEIRKRFDWTLDLDPRYRVLAYSLAIKSFDHPKIQIEGLNARELKDVAEKEWPDGFQSLARDEVVTLCDEMVQLRVFAERSGRYRLWSPNVMQLLGTRAEIEERLIYEALDPTAGIDAMQDRRPLHTVDDPRRSPLSYGDEQRLLDPGAPPVRVVFGTPATGWGALEEGLRMAVQSPDWPRHVLHPHSKLPSEGSLAHGSEEEWAVNFAPATRVDGDWLRSKLIALAAAVEGHQAIVVVAIGAEHIGSWAAIMTDLELDEDLDACTRPIVLRRWDRHSIGHWLDDIRVPNSGGDRERIIEVTGGWPSLVERFGVEARDAGLDAALERATGPEWTSELEAQLGLDQPGDLRTCAVALATSPDPLDATMLAQRSDDQLRPSDALNQLDALVMAQAVTPVKVGDAKRMSLEPRLAQHLR